MRTFSPWSREYVRTIELGVNTNSSSGSPVYTLTVGGPVNTLNCNTTNATCIDLPGRAGGSLIQLRERNIYNGLMVRSAFSLRWPGNMM